MTDTTKIKIDRDGNVTYWSVYEQQWVTCPARSVPDADLASMTDKARQRIAKVAAK